MLASVLDRVGQILVIGVVAVLLNRTGIERFVPAASTLLRLVEFALVIAVSSLGIVDPPGRVQCGVVLFVVANVSAYLYGAAYLDGGPPAFAIATSVGYLPLFAANGLALPERWLATVVGWASVPGLLLGAPPSGIRSRVPSSSRPSAAPVRPTSSTGTSGSPARSAPARSSRRGWRCWLSWRWVRC